MNLYAYVRNDPVNLVDPWGMAPAGQKKSLPVNTGNAQHPGEGEEEIIVQGRPQQYDFGGALDLGVVFGQGKVGGGTGGGSSRGDSLLERVREIAEELSKLCPAASGAVSIGLQGVCD